jgi:hypothetical protein
LLLRPTLWLGPSAGSGLRPSTHRVSRCPAPTVQQGRSGLPARCCVQRDSGSANRHRPAPPVDLHLGGLTPPRSVRSDTLAWGALRKIKILARAAAWVAQHHPVPQPRGPLRTAPDLANAGAGQHRDGNSRNALCRGLRRNVTGERRKIVGLWAGVDFRPWSLAPLRPDGFLCMK